MREFLKLSSEERKLIINNTADKKLVSNAIIEKDFWVCFMLQYLFTDFKYKDFICFKGGTSLSKGYDLIQRFSEDIDLVLNWTTLGYEKDEPYLHRSGRQQGFFNDKLNNDTQEFLSNDWIPEIEKDLYAILGNTFSLVMDEENEQTILFNYPQLFIDETILQEIRLEVGPLAEPTPAERISINPYIYDFYPQVFTEPNAIVEVVVPLRTFYEKLLILHRESKRINGNYPPRYSRHFYDIYRCLLSDLRIDSLNQLDLLDEVNQFKQKFYRCTWAKYDQINESGLDLIPNEDALDIFKQDYLIMSGMIFGEIPAFEEIIDEIRLYNIEINNAIKERK